jgi:serine/threonine protein kinase
MSDYMVHPIGSSEGREIGRGGSSQVKLVRDSDTGKLRAVKCFSGLNLDKGAFIQEVESLAQLNHPCVLRIVHWALPKAPRCAEIHTEYAERGSLEAVLQERRANPANAFMTWTRLGIAICDIVLGMRFVHAQQIIHRDLKPSNIFIRGDGRALIGDFGSSRFNNDDGTVTANSGTVHYAAPELFEPNAKLTPKVDVWGFGLILYEIVSGRVVFPLSLSPFDVIRKIRSRYRPNIPIERGEYMKGLIARCWSHDPSSRPSFDEILGEFQTRQFNILNEADSDALRDAVNEVLGWECQAHPRVAVVKSVPN